MSSLSGSALSAGTLIELPPLGGDTALHLLQQLQVGLFVDQDGAIAYANPALGALLGWSESELIGLDAQGVLVTPEFREPARAVVKRRLAGKSGRPGDMRFLRRDGSTVDARGHPRPHDFEGRPAVLVTVTHHAEL